MIRQRHVVIIGGGISGLVAALDCARVGIRVSVIEAGESLGGSVSRSEVAGLAIDTGAESYATRGGSVRTLVEGLGLGESIVTPEPAGAWLRRGDGQSFPMPSTGILGIPSNPLAADVRAIIGWSGAIRAYADRIKPVLTVGREKNLGALVESRMGERVLNELVAPVTRGVYSSDPENLDVDLAAPGLNAALTTTGSLSGAVGSLRGSAKPGSRVESLRGGMYTLVLALEAEIRRLGGSILTGVAVTELVAIVDGEAERVNPLDPEAEAVPAPEIPAEEFPADPEAPAPLWRVFLAADAALDADHVIIATTERTALGLAGAHTELGEAPAAAEPEELEILSLVLDAPALDAHPRGSGVLVADGPGSGVSAKALTHSTAKWAWLSEECTRLHGGRHVVRLSYGRSGARGASVGLDDTAARNLALRDASAILGVELAPNTVAGFTRDRHHSTLPGAALGQRERSSRLRRVITGIPGLDVTGAWLSGTGLASVVPDALAAAGRVRHLVAQSYLASGELS